MATIVGAVASSHTPTIGFAFDKRKQDDPVWAPIFEAYKPVQAWLADKKPDVLLIVFNDHVTSFFFDHYSQFALGIGESYRVADEGGGPRALPPVRGHAALSHHIAAGLVADEFDLSYFQDKPLDHGCFSPLSMLWPLDFARDRPLDFARDRPLDFARDRPLDFARDKPLDSARDRPQDPTWPGAIVPLQIGVLEFPIPSARRCYKLGQSLRKAIESYPENLKVALVATGGLSHQVHGERCGFNNPEWDLEFLDLIEKDPERLAGMTVAEFAERGGFEGAEVIMWLVMRGAMTKTVRKLHQSYYLPSMTGIATAIYEPVADQQPPAGPEYLARINHELAGVERLDGSYPFTLDRSVKAYRLNKFLHNLIEPVWRTRFRADQETLFEECRLTGEERHLVRRLDWRGLIHYGVSFFMLEKLGAVVGVSNLHIYAAMRGQTLEDFQKTRNAPGALYSVAGTDAGDQQKTWETVGTK